MIRLAGIIVGYLLCITLAQAEGSSANCVHHTWVATVGTTAALLDLDGPESHYAVPGWYYDLSNMEAFSLGVDEKHEDQWRLVYGRGLTKATLKVACVGQTLSGEWRSADGHVTLPVHAKIAGASFDCAKAGLDDVERTICGNPRLSALDFKLNVFYRFALQKFGPNDAGQLRVDQRKWLKRIHHFCDDESCLSKVYEFRIFELSQQLMYGHGYHHFIIPDVPVKVGARQLATGMAAAFLASNENERNKSFNSDLRHRKLSGTITQCELLIDVGVGVRDGNHSYGGICLLSRAGRESKVMICDDDMVGHFQMNDIDHRVSKLELTNYILSNCFGGG